MTILAALAASLLGTAGSLQDPSFGSGLPALAQDKSFDSRLPALAQDKQDERMKRILERVEKEIQESHNRLRDEIRAIIRAEIARGGEKAPPPVPPRKKVLLGITADDLSDADRKALGIGGGIKVAAARGPADQAGIKPGDILLELGGTPVTEETIGRTLEQFQPGETAEAVVFRDKKRVTLKITFVERKE